MARDVAGDFSVPSPLSIVGQDELDIVLRQNRLFYENQLGDRISYTIKDSSGNETTSFSSGDDIVLDFTASYDLGGTAVFETLDIERSQVSQQTSTNASGTVTFSSVGSSVSYVQAYVQNGSSNRVSQRFVGEVIVGSVNPHNLLPGHGKAGSEYEQQLFTIDETGIEKSDLDEVAGVVFNIYTGLKTEAQKAEEHIDLIAGLGYSDNPLQDSDLTNGAQPIISRLYPQSNRTPEPTTSDWNQGPSNFDSTAQSVIFYSDSNSGKSSGSDSEKQDLQNAKQAGTYPVSIYDHTQETSVSYASDSEIDTRISEIDTIISNFNSNSDVQEIFDDRWFWVRTYVHRIAGYKFQSNQTQTGIDSLQDEIDISDKIVTEIGS